MEYNWLLVGSEAEDREVRARACLCSLLFALCANGTEITVITEENPPFSFKQNATITGFSTDVVTELFRETGFQIRYFELFPWARAYHIGLTEPNTLIYSITKNNDREDKFKWVGPVADNTKYLYRMKHRVDINITSLSQARKYVVGAIRNGSVALLLQNEGFVVGENLELVPEKGANTRRLFANRIDLIANTKLGMAHQLKVLGLDSREIEIAYEFPDGGGYYLAFNRKTSDEIVVRFRWALDKMKQDGTLEKIRARYY